MVCKGGGDARLCAQLLLDLLQLLVGHGRRGHVQDGQPVRPTVTLQQNWNQVQELILLQTRVGQPSRSATGKCSVVPAGP